MFRAGLSVDTRCDCQSPLLVEGQKGVGHRDQFAEHPFHFIETLFGLQPQVITGEGEFSTRQFCTPPEGDHAVHGIVD